MSDITEKKYPCGFCDFIFTVIVSLFVTGGVRYFYPDLPWFAYALLAQSWTASWFLETRK